MTSSLVHLSHGTRTRFLSEESPPTNKSSTELESAKSCSSDRNLAQGILRQTARDLRRFSGARTRVQHDLYDDAYTWLMANDFAWPCSFLNVCATLGLPPEQTRGDLIKAATETWYSHLLTVARNAASSFGSSVAAAGTIAPGKASPPVQALPYSNRYSS